MANNRYPEEVFTPNAVATKAMFERRNEPDQFGNPGLQDRVIEAFRQQGAQLRVFGDTGVGKTSLITFAAAEVGRTPLIVECRTGHDYADLLEQAIRSIQGVRLTRYVRRSDVSASVEASGGYKFLASITGKVTGNRGKEREFEIVDSTPLDLLLELMHEKAYSLLVLDNFQNVEDPRTRLSVAQTMEVLADRAPRSGNLQLVVIGIAEDAHTLLTPSPSVRRRTVDVAVPRMPDEEIQAVLETGFSLLDLRLSQGLLDYLVFYSDGFPFFAHMIGLNVSRAARADGFDEIRQTHVAAGLVRTVNEVDETYKGRVAKAVESGGHVQPKRHLLNLLARSSQRTWTCADAKSLWREHFNSGDKNLQFVDVAMGSLVREENGRVLARDETSAPYKYRFEDPHFRAYLRIRAEFGEHVDTNALGSEPQPSATGVVYRDSLS